MSVTTEDPTKYFRTSFAIKLDQKVEFDRRLSELGIKGIGGLATFFTQQPGIVEALKPLAEQYHVTKKGSSGKLKEAAEKLKDMSPAELDRLIELAKSPL